MSFETKALLGYFLLALVLVVGMSLSFRRLLFAVDEQIARLRAAEKQITLVERLRWRSEVIVSDGRGYLLSGDPILLRAPRRLGGRVRWERQRPEHTR